MQSHCKQMCPAQHTDWPGLCCASKQQLCMVASAAAMLASGQLQHGPSQCRVKDSCCSSPARCCGRTDLVVCWPPPPEVVIVHCWQVIMDEAHCVDHLHGTRSGHCLVQVTWQHATQQPSTPGVERRMPPQESGVS